MAKGASIFGTPLRDRILAVLSVKGQSHVRELGKALGVTPQAVGYAVRQLERDGLVAAVAHGRTRVLQLNPRWYAKHELRALLERITEAQPELYEPITAVRGRPRRSGKPL